MGAKSGAEWLGLQETGWLGEKYLQVGHWISTEAQMQKGTGREVIGTFRKKLYSKHVDFLQRTMQNIKELQFWLCEYRRGRAVGDMRLYI
jgi:hypothetical protein